MKNRILQIKRVLSVALLVLLLSVAGLTNLNAQNNTSYFIETISNPAESGTVTITTYAQGEEKVINGDFEQGNTGFTSEYYYDYDFGLGEYYVDNNGHGYPGFGHGGMGNFMLLDGATGPGVVIWSEQVSVVPNTYYVFTTWVCSLNPESRALLQFSINGTQVGVFRAPSQTNTWEQFCAIWYSSNSTSATITILDQNTEVWGNDFGLDDISFRDLTMVGTSENTASVESGGVCIVTAVPNEDYFFECWKENNQIVSTKVSYSFVVTGDRNLTANFYPHQPGMLNGQFSVGENQLVYFSQGNLQYQASTNTWQFAEHQWDYVGEGNANASQTYDGWIDLFGWGTSGYNHGAMCYQPWSTSGNNDDYHVYGSSLSSLYDYNGQADWGYNPISNGGNTANQWHTLTQLEWNYVFNIRTTTSGIRYAKAKVNNVYGVILLPDDWNSNTYSLNNTNSSSTSFSSNTITNAQWTILEDAGAVFLPVGGYQYGTSFSYVDYYGCYWSALCNSDGHAYCVTFNDWYLDINYDNRCCSRNVRLVRPAQDNASYNIEAVPNPVQGGSVTGAGTYNYYNQVTLTANTNEGYTFYQWKENGNVVSTENPYTFVALFDRSLEAVFLESSTYPLLYSFNEDDYTATVTGHWDGQNATGELVIPETVMHNGETYTVTTIGSWAFSECSGLASLVIPSTVTDIRDHAFYGCSGIVGELVIPSSIPYIAEGAFEYCRGITSVTYGTALTYIGNYAFRGCSSLASFELPNTLTSIGEWAFSECPITSIVLPSSLNSIGNEAFRDCSGLTEIVIPSSVTSIGDVNPFGGCSNLAQITVESGNAYYDSRDDSYAIIETATNRLVSGSLSTIIPNTVVSIGQNAFYRIQLSSITIPASVNHIGDWAFGDINTLPSMMVLAEVPPTLGGCAFCGSDHSIPVYVPCGSLEMYQNAEGWRDYGGFDFVELCPGVVTVTANPAEYGTVTGGGSFEGGETCTVVATPNEGCFFAYWSENGRMVSAETTYSFLVIGNRDLTANFYTPQPGMINGLFSVSADQMVCFSQGNLQYQASTNTWRFAEHQWDFVGESNSNASPTYDGWIDLYAWATSGYNHATDGYQPWSGGCNAYDGDFLSLYDRTGKADWGYNAISNGGNEERLWRTCTGSEFGYLMFDRQTASGIRFAKATIGETNGVILFPDNWAATLYNLSNVNQGEAPYDGNVISLEVWVSVFEANGAVFLPASGRIQAWAENDYNQCGVYWNSNDVYGYLKGLLSFGEDSMGLGAYYTGEHYSVRLVRAPANASYAIEAVSNPVDAGTVEGSGVYDYYTAASLTAIPNEGYTFYCWKENGRIVSTDNTCEVLALFDRNLEACFLESSTYPLLYSFNEDDHTATVIGHWDGTNATGDLVIPETVVHNGETYIVTAIGRAFEGCTGLTSVVLSNSIVFIESYAFAGCSGLTEITIPSSVTSIGGINPFGNCHNLAQITVESGNAYYDSRDNCNAIINTSTNCLISGSSSTFIPNSVTSLGQDAFYGISILSLTVYAETPPIVGIWALADVNRDIPVYVPCASIEAYQNAEGWNEFTNIQEEYFHELAVISSDENMGTVAILQEPDCEHDAIVQATPIGDYSFFCWTENGEIVSTEATYTLPVEEDRTLTAHFGSLTNHWTPSGSYQNSMFMIGVVQIDGVEQASPFLELGAFCNGECRGSEFPFEDGGQWLYFMTIGGNASDEITFRLYDHFLQQELNLYCFNVIPFEMYGLIGIEEPYEVQFISILTISANVSPENAGTITGAGEYLLGSDVTLTANANEGYVFNSWTVDGEIVSTEPSYTFTVTSEMSFIANFDALYSVSATVNLENAGTIIGTGNYVSGTEATLIATPNEGYAFNNWTLDGEVVSTEPSYTFTVIESVNLTANFDIIQTYQLTVGWNWWSTYLDITLDDLKAALVEALPNTIITIKSQGQNAKYKNGRWSGQLTSLDATRMYRISVSTACEITVKGVPFNYAEHPVTIMGNGITWLGFPLSENMSISGALSGFSVVNGDIIKSQTNNAIYNRGAWRGALTTFESGKGYKFISKSSEDRTLVFPTVAK